MQVFNFYRDQKITIWERDHFSITATDREQAEQMLREIENEGFDRDDERLCLSHSETLFDTGEVRSLVDNGGNATVEYYAQDGGMVFDNTESLLQSIRS